MSDLDIVLVEDNADDELLTLRALKKNNIANHVTVARDGAEAIEVLLGPNRVEAALVLLDLRLPKMHGLEVLERLRADPRTRLLPVVVLTSSAEEPDLRQAYSLGANSYVRKPVDFVEFMNTAAHLGMYWLLINRPPPSPGA